jgi:hypothetical protein
MLATLCSLLLIDLGLLLFVAVLSCFIVEEAITVSLLLAANIGVVFETNGTVVDVFLSFSFEFKVGATAASFKMLEFLLLGELSVLTSATNVGVEIVPEAIKSGAVVTFSVEFAANIEVLLPSIDFAIGTFEFGGGVLEIVKGIGNAVEEISADESTVETEGGEDAATTALVTAELLVVLFEVVGADDSSILAFSLAFSRSAALIEAGGGEETLEGEEILEGETGPSFFLSSDTELIVGTATTVGEATGFALILLVDKTLLITPTEAELF